MDSPKTPPRFPDFLYGVAFLERTSERVAFVPWPLSLIYDMKIPKCEKVDFPVGFPTVLEVYSLFLLVVETNAAAYQL
jgi:hypothetical protein